MFVGNKVSNSVRYHGGELEGVAVFKPDNFVDNIGVDGVGSSGGG